MLPLLPLLLPLVPQLARWIAGTTGGEVAQQAVDVVRQVVGSDDPGAVAAALEADPAKRAAVQVELARIAADREARAADAAAEQLRAIVADVANARGQTVALAQAGSALAWGPAIVTIGVLAIFAGTLWALFTGRLPEGQMGFILVGAIAAWGGQAVSYWLGTSASSGRKDSVIAAAAGQLAVSVPVAQAPFGQAQEPRR